MHLSATSSANDFDFLMGTWRVTHHRLRERLVGCQEWQTFDGCCVMQTVLGGRANLDDNLLNLPEGPYRALSLRSYDEALQQWAIWWLDDRHPHRLDVPVMGRFEGGIGPFYADDVVRGQAIRVRFRWTETQTISPLWEQAFSADAGETWEVNWTMRFVRRHATASVV